MTNLKIVEKSTNTQILDEMMSKYDDLEDRLTNRENSIYLERHILPSTKDFNGIRSAVSTLLCSKIKKERGSDLVLSILNEIILVAENDDDQKKIDAIIRNGDHIQRDRDDVSYNLSKDLDGSMTQDLLNGIGQDNPQLCNTSFNADIHDQARLNIINPFVTSASILIDTKVRDFRFRQPVSKLVDYRYGVGNRFSDKLSNQGYYFRPYSKDNFGSLTFGDDAGAAKYIYFFKRLYWTNMVTSGLHEKLDQKKTTVEELNNIPTTDLLTIFGDFDPQIEEINQKLRDYTKSCEMKLSDFLELVPQSYISNLDTVVDHYNKVDTRKASLVDKKVNIDITFNIDCLVETTGNPEDIKKIITDYLKEAFLSSDDESISERYSSKVKKTKVCKIENLAIHLPSESDQQVA